MKKYFFEEVPIKKEGTSIHFDPMPIYVIYRRGRKFNNLYFNSYERARQYVRKWLRSKYGEFAYRTPDGSNPIMCLDGFSIKRG